MCASMGKEPLLRPVPRRKLSPNSLYGNWNPLCTSVFVEAEVGVSCRSEQMHAKVKADLVTVWGEWHLPLTTYEGPFTFPSSFPTSSPEKDFKTQEEQPLETLTFGEISQANVRPQDKYFKPGLPEMALQAKDTTLNSVSIMMEMTKQGNSCRDGTDGH